MRNDGKVPPTSLYPFYFRGYSHRQGVKVNGDFLSRAHEGGDMSKVATFYIY